MIHYKDSPALPANGCTGFSKEEMMLVLFTAAALLSGYNDVEAITRAINLTKKLTEST